VWLVLIAFIVITAGSFGILMLFVSGGRNRESEVSTPRGRRPLVFGFLTHALAGMLPIRPETRQRYCRLLRQAGHYHSQALAEYLALRNALVAGSLILILATIVVVTEPGEPAMYQIAGGGLIVIALLFSLPRLGLEAMAKARARRIEESLPDAMDMITMCTSAGLPLQHAIARISDELQSSHPDLAFELRIVGRHAEAGSLSSAVQHFAKRLDVPEIHSVAAMVWQAEQQGAGVAGAFQAFSDQVRLNRRQRAEEAGNKAAFKMLFPLVLCLMPAVFLVLLGPAVLQLRDFFRDAKQPGGALSVGNVRSLTAAPTGIPGLPPSPVSGTPPPPAP
jgi:tight adherence protein C